MNKRTLNSYLRKNVRDLLKENCFKCNDMYLISDTFSIIKLCNNYDLSIQEDVLNLKGHLENFENNFELSYTFDKFDNGEQVPLDENFEINVKLCKKIKNIVKPNSLIQVLENKDKNAFMKYLIKLENTKTKEVGYLLPMKKI